MGTTVAINKEGANNYHCCSLVKSRLAANNTVYFRGYYFSKANVTYYKIPKREAEEFAQMVRRSFGFNLRVVDRFEHWVFEVKKGKTTSQEAFIAFYLGREFSFSAGHLKGIKKLKKAGFPQWLAIIVELQRNRKGPSLTNGFLAKKKKDFYKKAFSNFSYLRGEGTSTNIRDIKLIESDAFNNFNTFKNALWVNY